MHLEFRKKKGDVFSMVVDERYRGKSSTLPTLLASVFAAMSEAQAKYNIKVSDIVHLLEMRNVSESKHVSNQESQNSQRGGSSHVS